MSIEGLGSGTSSPPGVLSNCMNTQVPDLDEALLAAVGWASAGPVLRPLVPEDLRARAARSHVGHAPVVVLAEALDTSGGHADLVAPDGLGLVVAEVHRHPQPLGVEADHAGDELPGPGAGRRT